jgi:alginate O-acetyltransferase complex protein AlgI
MTMLSGYSCQIFADFAGYSLIAIGLAKLFGYSFFNNFKFPYIATSFKEFWKRWHISLSTFLMQYLYKPLGGNRRGPYRTYLNLFIVMFLGGLWHGAAWSYAIWGVFHGCLLAVERFLGNIFKMPSYKAISFFKTVFVFSMVTMGWLLFKMPKIEHVFAFVKSLLNNVSIGNSSQIIIYVILYSLPVFLYHAFYLVSQRSYFAGLKKMEFAFYGFMLFLIVLNSGTPGTFIYFQF